MMHYIDMRTDFLNLIRSQMILKRNNAITLKLLFIHPDHKFHYLKITKKCLITLVQQVKHVFHRTDFNKGSALCPFKITSQNDNHV